LNATSKREGEPKEQAHWLRRQQRLGWLYVAPAMAFFLLMIAYPIGRSLYLSFFDYSILEPDSARFVGLGNYEKLATQEQNRLPFGNTLYFTAIFVPAYVIGPC
jgi:multiple sugar transport system permease protein